MNRMTDEMHENLSKFLVNVNNYASGKRIVGMTAVVVTLDKPHGIAEHFHICVPGKEVQMIGHLETLKSLIVSESIRNIQGENYDDC